MLFSSNKKHSDNECKAKRKDWVFTSVLFLFSLSTSRILLSHSKNKRKREETRLKVEAIVYTCEKTK